MLHWEELPSLLHTMTTKNPSDPQHLQQSCEKISTALLTAEQILPERADEIQPLLAELRQLKLTPELIEKAREILQQAEQKHSEEREEIAKDLENLKETYDQLAQEYQEIKGSYQEQQQQLQDQEEQVEQEKLKNQLSE